MIRFVPDGWLDGLMRPLLLADPVGGLYVEIQAPDWRFAALLLLVLLAALGHRRPGLFEPAQWRLLLGLAASFYLWTFISGNGRYFLWGLMLAGPLVVVAARRLKATLAMRNTVVVGVLALQAWTVSMTFVPNGWALRPWMQGPGLAPMDTPLRHEPAVFVTIGGVSQSFLAAVMHPQSRWTNMGGQHDFVPGTRDHAQLQALLSSPLPKYAVLRAARQATAAEVQPAENLRTIMRRSLAPAGLEPAARPCSFARSDMGGPDFTDFTRRAYDTGFWFCPVTSTDGPRTAPLGAAFAPELDDVFARVEQRCPRMFPPGNARTRPSGDGASRGYSHSDIALTVDGAGIVRFEHMRAPNPTELGSVADVRAGRFVLDCDRLPGRYLPPWARR